MEKETFKELTAGTFIFLWLYAFITKLISYHKFVVTLGRSPLLGQVAPFVAVPVLTTELALAVLLFFPSSRKVGMIGSLTLMSIFTLYIAYMLCFEPHLPCACGGLIQQMGWKLHLLFNIFFVLLSVLWLRTKSREQVVA